MANEEKNSGDPRMEGNKHRTAFKNSGKNLEEMRRRRGEFTSELRKQRKEELLQKRRVVDDEKSAEEDGRFNNLEDVLSGLADDTDEDRQGKALRVLKRLLRTERPAVKHAIIQSKMVPPLVRMLARDNLPHVQFQAAWALTNLASGRSEHTRALVRAGAIPALVRLIGASGSPPQVKEQSAWALGNIAADNERDRDLVLENGLIPCLLRALGECEVLSFIRQAAWLMSVICHSVYSPLPTATVRQLLAPLNVFLNHTDSSLVAETCWTLSHITDSLTPEITELFDSDFIKKLFPLLEKDNIRISDPALQTVGNFIAYEGPLADVVYEAGVLKILPGLLERGHLKLCKYALWSVGNLLIGDETRVDAVLQTPKLIDLMVSLMDSGGFEVKKEAACSCYNALACGATQHAECLVRAGCLPPLCRLLTCPGDTELLMTCLKALELVLKNASRAGQLEGAKLIIESSGGLAHIENLQNHENANIYRKSYQIVDKFFSVGPEEVVAPPSPTC